MIEENNQWSKEPNAPAKLTTLYILIQNFKFD